MDNPDRLQWTDFFAFKLYGARIGIRANEPHILTQVLDSFPPLWKPYVGEKVDWQYSFWVAPPTRTARNPFHVLYSNQERIALARKLTLLLNAFEHDVQLAVAQKARRKVFVHAGVVGWQGRAILIPGRSYSGKSTLVRELVRAGAIYYSDEYAVLDERGRVHPFPRPLALRDDKRVNRKIPFQELGGQIGAKPLPVRTIFVTKYREGGEMATQAIVARTRRIGAFGKHSNGAFRAAHRAPSLDKCCQERGHTKKHPRRSRDIRPTFASTTRLRNYSHSAKFFSFHLTPPNPPVFIFFPG